MNKETPIVRLRLHTGFFNFRTQKSHIKLKATLTKLKIQKLKKKRFLLQNLEEYGRGSPWSPAPASPALAPTRSRIERSLLGILILRTVKGVKFDPLHPPSRKV